MNNFFNGFEKQASAYSNIKNVGKLVGSIARKASNVVKSKTIRGQFGKAIEDAYRGQAIRDGMVDSFVAWPFIAGAKKVMGNRKVMRHMWEKIQKPALNADTVLGAGADKVVRNLPGGKNLFKQKDLLPWGKGIKKEVTRTSLFAPAVKAKNIAAPIALGSAVDKAMNKRNKSE